MLYRFNVWLGPYARRAIIYAPPHGSARRLAYRHNIYLKTCSFAQL
jgi:hypothetical protein